MLKHNFKDQEQLESLEIQKKVPTFWIDRLES